MKLIGSFILIACGSLSLIFDYLHIVDLVSWVTTNAPGKGGPSLLPLIIIGALSIIVIVLGTQKLIAMTRTGPR